MNWVRYKFVQFFGLTDVAAELEAAVQLHGRLLQDVGVLRLADEGRVVLHQDVHVTGWELGILEWN